MKCPHCKARLTRKEGFMVYFKSVVKCGRCMEPFGLKLNFARLLITLMIIATVAAICYFFFNFKIYSFTHAGMFYGIFSLFASLKLTPKHS